MNHITIIVALAFGISLFYVLVNNTMIIYAQQLPSSPSHSLSSVSPASTTTANTSILHAVKITSPVKGQQVPLGKGLTIVGISLDNTTSNCQVSVIVNGVKPYQPATAVGPRGASDYSKWNFVLTPKYTTIKQGPNNKITAKYTCSSNPLTASFYSVDVSGVPVAATATTGTRTNTVSAAAFPHTTIPSSTVTSVPTKQKTPVVSNNNATVNGASKNVTSNSSVSYKPIMSNNATSANNGTSGIGLTPHNSQSIDYLGYHRASGSSTSNGYNNNSISKIPISKDKHKTTPTIAAVTTTTKHHNPIVKVHTANSNNDNNRGRPSDESTSTIATTASRHHNPTTTSATITKHHIHSTNHKTKNLGSAENSSPEFKSNDFSDSNSKGNTLHDQINSLKDNIMDNVKNELQRNGINFDDP